jgi:hypothetical protein
MAWRRYGAFYPFLMRSLNHDERVGKRTVPQQIVKVAQAPRWRLIVRQSVMNYCGEKMPDHDNRKVRSRELHANLYIRGNIQRQSADRRDGRHRAPEQAPILTLRTFHDAGTGNSLSQ